jgi:hypothetical protein
MGTKVVATDVWQTHLGAALISIEGGLVSALLQDP